jgi:hypothetical protein
MSEHNVAIVRRIYANWAPGSSPGESNLLHPDIEWVNPSDALEPGTRAGIEVFTSVTERLDETIGALRMDVERLVDAGDRVVVIATIRDTGSQAALRSSPARLRLDHPRREGSALPMVPRAGRSPRSRRAGKSDLVGRGLGVRDEIRLYLGDLVDNQVSRETTSDEPMVSVGCQDPRILRGAARDTALGVLPMEVVNAADRGPVSQ